MDIARDIIIVIIAGLFGGLAAKKLNQPLILGYILAGIAVGSYTGGITISNISQIESLAEIGVALLLFSLGLEFSLKSILPIRAVAIGGASIQILLTVGLCVFIGNFLGWTTLSSLWFAGAVVSSSTAIIMKTLSSRGQLGTLSSLVMLSVSIVQDILVIPFMVLLINLNSSGFSAGGMAFPVVKVLLFVGVMFYIGARIIPILLKWVARWDSGELFLLAVTAIGLGIGYLSYSIGLSFAFGAFLAGIVLSESDYGRRALSDLIPVRDVFGLLFFVTIGMLLDPVYLASTLGVTLGLVAAACLGKGAILAGVVRLFGYGNVIPLAVFFGMIPISEIAFIVLQAGLSSGALPREIYSLFLNTVILSMLLGPLISGLTAPVYTLWKKMLRTSEIQTVNIPGKEMDRHVILTGGSLLHQTASILRHLRMPYVIIEPNHTAFLRGREEGYPLILGDPSQDVILDAAETSSARLAVVTVRDRIQSHEIIKALRRKNKNMRILAISVGDTHAGLIEKTAVQGIVNPDVEAGLEMARQVLLSLEFPATSVQNELNALRRTLYAPLIESIPEYGAANQLRDAACLMDMEWAYLKKGNPLTGKSLAQTALRQKHGVSVVAVGRDGQVISNPAGDFVFQDKDYLGIIGDPERNLDFLAFLKKSTPSPEDAAPKSWNPS